MSSGTNSQKQIREFLKRHATWPSEHTLLSEPIISFGNIEIFLVSILKFSISLPSIARFMPCPPILFCKASTWSRLQASASLSHLVACTSTFTFARKPSPLPLCPSPHLRLCTSTSVFAPPPLHPLFACVNADIITFAFTPLLFLFLWGWLRDGGLEVENKSNFDKNNNGKFVNYWNLIRYAR